MITAILGQIFFKMIFLIFCREDLSITIILIGSSFGGLVFPVLMGRFLPLPGHYRFIPTVCGGLGVLFIFSYLMFHFSMMKQLSGDSLTANTSPSVPSNNLSVNTYQRAQTMMFEQTKRFQFNRSSADLTRYYQYEQVSQG